MHFHNPNSLQNIFYQVIRLHHQRSHMLLDKVGVYPGQPFLLFALYHSNGQSQKDLANKLNIKAATITIMVKRMEKVGLVERRQDLEDMRVSRVYITEKGLEVCKEVEEIRKVIEAESFKDFTEDEKMMLRKLLVKMRDNLEQTM